MEKLEYTKTTALSLSKRQRDDTKNSNYLNKKKFIKKQIEFYFSDVNLINDKFLYNLMNSDIEKAVDIKTILSFNKIKNFLDFFLTEEEKINFIKKSIRNSNLIKLTPSNKIERKNKFILTESKAIQADKCTIYIENLPSNTTHEMLTHIFQGVGKIGYISLPKNKEKRCKGFAFITFTSEPDLNLISEINNTVPKDFILSSNDSSIDPIFIISKSEWNQKKAEFKKLKLELMRENSNIFCDYLPEESTDANCLCPNTLVRISNLPKQVNKYVIWTLISNFVQPTYVDYDESTNECIVRFSFDFQAEAFFNKVKQNDLFRIKNHKLVISKLDQMEETKYFQKIVGLRVKSYK